MRQQQWTKKEERQYRHIRDQARDRGQSRDRAEEIAARTVDKQRAHAGETRTVSRTSTEDMSAYRPEHIFGSASVRRGRGRRSHSGPKGRTKEQRYQEARRKNFEGRSTMTKAELERALKRK